MADCPVLTSHSVQEARPGGVLALILFSSTSGPDWLDPWQQESKQWLPRQRVWPEEAWGNFLCDENFPWRDKTRVTRVYSFVSSDEAELVRSVHSAGVEPEVRSSRQGGAVSWGNNNRVWLWWGSVMLAVAPSPPDKLLIKYNFSLNAPPTSFPLKMSLINKEKCKKKNEDSGRLH